MVSSAEQASEVGGLSLGKAEPSVRICLNALSQSLRAFQRASQIETRLQALEQLQEDVSGICNLFQLLRLQLPTSICQAFGNLLAALGSNLDNINLSSLRTASRAVDFLNRYISSDVLFSTFADSPLEVLIIDDNEVCRQVLKMALRGRELKVTECADGEEALKTVATRRFELVFSDIMMPRVDGFALVSALRGLPQYAAVPLIFVTVLSDFETRARSISKGCVDLIAKPFVPSEIVLKALTAGWGARLDHHLDQLRAGRGPGSRAERSANQKLAGLRGIFCLELNGRIHAANDDCGRIFECPASAMVGRHILEFLPGSLQTEEYARYLTDIMAGRGKPMGGLRLVGLSKDSQHTPLLVSINETHSQGRRLLVASLRHAC